MAGVLNALSAIETNTRFNYDHMEREARKLLAKYGSLIEQWRGPIPASIVAVRIQVEGGSEKTYVASTGEAGLLQLWPATQQKYGVTDPYDPAQNIRAGLLHWRSETDKLVAAWKPTGLLQDLSSEDFWTIAQLNTMIGAGATKKLLAACGARPGSEYRDLLAYVRKVGEGLESLSGYFGTQSASLIAHRIAAAGRMTLVARRLGGFGGGLVAMLAVGAATYYLVTKLLPRLGA